MSEKSYIENIKMFNKRQKIPYRLYCMNRMYVDDCRYIYSNIDPNDFQKIICLLQCYYLYEFTEEEKKGLDTFLLKEAFVKLIDYFYHKPINNESFNESILTDEHIEMLNHVYNFQYEFFDRDVEDEFNEHIRSTIFKDEYDIEIIVWQDYKPLNKPEKLEMTEDRGVITQNIKLIELEIYDSFERFESNLNGYTDLEKMYKKYLPLDNEQQFRDTIIDVQTEIVRKYGRTVK
ncbi:hypothetical protein ACN0TX_12020 [Staphylococcus cohnii]|uniref:hypothetical protein n=1 Tax=Staphylococcus cohnii TaxID=29382 RepID=UPI003AF988CC